MTCRILVTDDSAVTRTFLRRLFDADPSLEVVGEATNGREAVEMTESLRPDVITMDVAMPVMDGVEATRQIMRTNPTPIVVISGSLDPNDVKQVFRVMDAGALAILEKPPSPADPRFDSSVEELVATVKLMSEVKVVRRRQPRPDSAPVTVRPPRKKPPGIVAIGASTGGPAALDLILRDLPADFPVPIVVVQHIARGFEQGLVDWLQSTSPLHVRLGAGRMPLKAGEVVISAGGHHLLVTRSAATQGDGAAVDGHCPSATVLFSSVAKTWKDEALGVILTGMGRDGTGGLVDLKKAGGTVIAQDAASSVVHGMPRAAEESGVVDYVLPLADIAPAIRRICDPPSLRRSG